MHTASIYNNLEAIGRLTQLLSCICYLELLLYIHSSTRGNKPAACTISAVPKYEQGRAQIDMLKSIVFSP